MYRRLSPLLAHSHPPSLCYLEGSEHSTSAQNLLPLSFHLFVKALNKDGHLAIYYEKRPASRGSRHHHNARSTLAQSCGARHPSFIICLFQTCSAMLLPSSKHKSLRIRVRGIDG
ncbi:hypothetical protein BU25DRAFT_414592, partial [Macroventuria anomochaeta]